MLGHMAQKCPKLDYDKKVVKKFERHLENIGGFHEAIERREKSHREKVAKWCESKLVPVPAPAVAAGGTTQLSKPRLPPLWSGQKFDRWKIEVEKWCDNNKWTDEEKYIDLLESLKKNDEVKQFVVNTLTEKFGSTRKFKKILEVMTEKFSKTTSEKTSEMMKNISGDGFKTDDKIDVIIDKF